MVLGSIPVLREVRRQTRPPGPFTLGVGLGPSMAEEVHVEGARGLRPNARQLAAQGVHTEHGRRKRTEPSCSRHGDGQRAVLHACHRRLNYRVLDPEELLQKHRSGLHPVSGSPPASPACHTATVTRRKVAGIEVPSRRALLF